MSARKPPDRALLGRLRVESREVLAGAYVSRVSRGEMLVHAVVVSAAGIETRVLCNRVALYNLADPCASDPQAPVTCPACRRLDPRVPR